MLIFILKQNFTNILGDVYVDLRSQHPMLQGWFRIVNVDMLCKCLGERALQQLKTHCFILNYIVDKIKVFSLFVVPESIQLLTIDEYLKKKYNIYIYMMAILKFCLRQFLVEVSFNQKKP